MVAPRLSNSQAPLPSVKGTIETTISSRRPAARYCCATSAPPPRDTSLSPAAARCRLGGRLLLRAQAQARLQIVEDEASRGIPPRDSGDEPLAAGITGSTVYVDKGYHVMGKSVGKAAPGGAVGKAVAGGAANASAKPATAEVPTE